MGPARVVGAGQVGPGFEGHRVAAPRFVDDGWVEPFKVVRADQPEGDVGVYSHIEQSLVQLALLDLSSGSTGPNRFTDTSGRPGLAGPGFQESLPNVDEEIGVAAHQSHIDKQHVLELFAQTIAQPLGMLRPDRNHDGLTTRQAINDERHQGGGEIGGIAPQPRLVTETLERTGRRKLGQGHRLVGGAEGARVVGSITIKVRGP